MFTSHHLPIVKSQIMFQTFLLQISLTILLSIYNVGGTAVKICPEVQSQLDKGEKVNVIVTFVNGAQPALDKAKTFSISERGQRNKAIAEALQGHMDTTQSGVVTMLSARSSGGEFKYFKQYWTSNKIFIKEASADVIKAIAEDAQVLKIKNEPIGKLPFMKPTVEDGPFDLKISGDNKPGEEGLWGIRKAQVAEAWQELGGKNGEGVIVGSIDTGVRHTHEALKGNFYGTNYGWYDARNKTQVPVDIGGHGTHTMGILAGVSYGIGVAPGVRWMTCLACDAGLCQGEALLDCIKFFACPHLPDGSNPDCSKAPHIVSNSWEVIRGAEDFNEDIKTWREMGIIPVFAIGNAVAKCNTTAAPGELPYVIGVGASDDNDYMSIVSGIGLASDGGMKPDVVAPGDFIASAYNEDDTNYNWLSGTSMATPFAAGVVALLKVRKPDLTYDEAYKLITETAVPLHNFFHNSDYCNLTSREEIPNVFFGYGEVSALKAVQAQTKLLNANK